LALQVFRPSARFDAAGICALKDTTCVTVHVALRTNLPLRILERETMCCLRFDELADLEFAAVAEVIAMSTPKT
jgi:hypothetical protein